MRKTLAVLLPLFFVLASSMSVEASLPKIGLTLQYKENKRICEGKGIFYHENRKYVGIECGDEMGYHRIIEEIDVNGERKPRIEMTPSYLGKDSDGSGIIESDEIWEVNP